MHRFLIVSLMLYSASPLAADCLQLQRNDDLLTFFYARQDEDDRPYFYAKVAMDESVLDNDGIMALDNYLERASRSSPRQYRIPGNAKKLYIIKSFSEVKNLSLSSRVIPAIVDDNHDGTVETVDISRGAGNHPQESIPPVTRDSRTRGSVASSDREVNICEFSL